MKGQIDNDRLLDVVEALEALDHLIMSHNDQLVLEPAKLYQLMVPHVRALRGLYEEAERSIIPPEERDRVESE